MRWHTALIHHTFHPVVTCAWLRLATEYLCGTGTNMYSVHLRHIRFHLCENSFPRSNTMDFVYGNSNGNEAEARAFNIC